jgi:solute carrier family 25 phosphate transporter 3
VTKQVAFELFATYLFALATSASLAIPNEEIRLLTTVASAFFASILACTVSQPGDVLLTKTFKENEKDSPIENAKQLLEDKGIEGLFAGYSARLAHVASIVTSQLVVYDVLKQMLGLPATGA